VSCWAVHSANTLLFDFMLRIRSPHLGERVRADDAHLFDRRLDLAGHEPRRSADQLDEVGLRVPARHPDVLLKVVVQRLGQELARGVAALAQELDRPEQDGALRVRHRG
jgi:hypothetical protein